jgi:hypothetical protein
MSFLRTLILGVMFWVFLNPASVFAQSHNHEGHHQNEITSPFEIKKENTSLHCLLGFHAQTEICPHSNSLHDKTVPVTIASDCGGKTSGALPKTASFNYNFAELISVPLITKGLKSSALIAYQFSPYHHFNKSLSPPPRTI